MNAPLRLHRGWFAAATILMAVAATGCKGPTAPTAGAIALKVIPASVPASGGTLVVEATVTTSGGAPVPNLTVSFNATAGTLSAATAPTDIEGVARVTLQTNRPTTVSAQANGQEAKLDLTVDVTVTMNVSSESPRRGEQVTVTVDATSAGQPISGTLTVDFGDGTVRNLGEVSGTVNVTHSYNREGTFTIEAVFVRDVVTTKRSSEVQVQGFAPGADQIDPKLITWLSPATTNISDWPPTSKVTNVVVAPPTVCIDHEKAGRWPLVSIDDNPPNIEANILIVVNVNGRWYGGGFDWLGGGRTCKTVDPSEYGRDQIRVPPLDHGWPGPRSGEEVGLLISTPSSNRIPVRSVNERTNIVLVRWP